MTTSRISGIIPLLLITLLCLGMVEGGCRLLERFLLAAGPAGGPGAAGAPAEKLETRPAAAKKTINADMILQRNLFGAVMGGEAVAAPVVVERPQTIALSGLDVVLMGTITGSEGTERAIILDKGSSKQDLYGKGEAIKGALVREIRRGKVVLAQNGRDEILDISEAAKVRPRGPATPLPAPQTVAPQTAAAQTETPQMPAPESVAEPVNMEEAPGPPEMPQPAVEQSDTGAKVRPTRVSQVARGKKPVPINPISNATQQQGNTNE